MTENKSSGGTPGPLNLATVKKERKTVRAIFTKNANTLEAMLEHEITNDPYPDAQKQLALSTMYYKVQELQHRLDELDKEARQFVRLETEEEIEKEMEATLEYKSRWHIIEISYKNKILSRQTTTSTTKEKRSFKLPTLKFITFDGELKNWLPFWGQCQKIDKDKEIDFHDKYQYLLQSMKEGTEPRTLVESFSATSYTECMELLKTRYARDELLIQVYVRELLDMINKTEKTTITNLFDKLCAQLRALETLGVTKDKFAAFLLPMIESALPEDILQIWERTKKESSSITTELSDLLAFLRKEVESEQRIKLAKKTLEMSLDADPEQTKDEPTVGCLLTNIKPKQVGNKCIWCDKDSHTSLECYKLQKLTIDERRAMLKQKKACAICLKRGHHPKSCRAFVKCIVCGLRHAVVLCTGKQQDAKNNSSNNHSAVQAQETPTA